MCETPECLYRVFTDEKIANEFLLHGKIWVFSGAKYRHLADNLRRDDNEGLANYLCGLPEPYPIAEYASNQFYVFSTFGPKTDLSRMMAFGKYKVKIKSPSRLQEDFNNLKPQNIISCVLKPVNYNENRVQKERDFWISMTQKKEKYREDCEYRYIFESDSMRNYGEQDCLDGGYDFRRPEGMQVLPAKDTLHIELDLKKKPEYLEKAW